MTCLKRALKRDESIPQGVASPLHVDCECGQAVAIETPSWNACPGCGTVYDGGGWIIATITKEEEPCLTPQSS